MTPLRKYPRTHHLEGSRLQPGDEDLDTIPFAEIAGQNLVVEEKVDGANTALSFSDDGEMLLQSRGHYLTGGSREKHFALLKTWASCHCVELQHALGTRYVLYGEWVYAKHTVYYDTLPHYFLEFDMLDRQRDVFLSTEHRRELLAGLPIVSVPVLWQGKAGAPSRIHELVAPSLFKSPQWREVLTAQAREQGLDSDVVWKETDYSDLAEGLYIKHERDGLVLERYKYIRASFLTSVIQSGSHWLHRPIVSNRLAEGVDIYRGADA
jgi:hypothetical protein